MDEQQIQQEVSALTHTSLVYWPAPLQALVRLVLPHLGGWKGILSDCAETWIRHGKPEDVESIIAIADAMLEK